MKRLWFAGRVTMAKYILSSVLTYMMQLIILPKDICKKLNQVIHKFIWVGNATPINQDGIGFRETHMI